MSLVRFWNRLNPFIRSRQARALHGLRSAHELQTILEQERNRADRTGREFSVVVFDVGNSDQDRAAVRHLVQVLDQRLRSTDEVGWFDEGRIGVVLPDTPAEGAWMLADDVCETIAANGPRPACTVYTYPSWWLPGGNKYPRQRQFADIVPEWDKAILRGLYQLVQPPAGGGTASAIQPTPTKALSPRRPVEGLETLFVRRLPLWKRAMDIIGAIVGLIISSPVMLAAAIVIKLTSRGPILFKQERAGRGAKPFTFYKFRSMVVEAEGRKNELMKFNEQTGPVFKIKNDPRVTRVGRILRRLSIDELPQFWNVLKGDMTLVGPRPLPCDESDASDQWQKRRLTVTPGLTCFWQVSGRSEVGFENWVRMDIRYAKARSLLLDLKILFRTLPAVLSRRGAH